MATMPKAKAPARLQDYRCSYCHGGPIDRATRTCPECFTTMPTNWEEFKDTPHKITSGGISSWGAVLANDMRYHGPGQRITEVEFE